MNFKNKDQEVSVKVNLKKLLVKIPNLRLVIETLNKNKIKYGLYAGAHEAV